MKRNKLQTKQQDENLQEQLNEVKIGNLPEKKNQNNDNKDDPRSQKKNGSTDWEDARCI